MRIDTASFEVDARARPLVVTTLRDLGSVDAVRALGKAYVAVLSRGIRQFFVTDIGSPPRYDATVRHAIADMVRDLAPLECEWSAGAVVVVRAPLVRATMTAIRWVSKPVVPETYVATLREAADVAELRMRDEGMAIDDAVASAFRAMRLGDR